MEFRIEFTDGVRTVFPFFVRPPYVNLCAETEEEAKALFKKNFERYGYSITDISIVDYRPVSDL